MHIVDIEQAAELLKAGINVAFPTETVYGLGARVFDEKSVQNIFRMKGRPSDNPLICHIATLDQIHLLAREVPKKALELAQKHWPGPLTIVLKKHPSVPRCVTGGHDTVAIRMPNHPLALQLIEMVGPLVGPSANLSGSPSSTTAQHVLTDFAGIEGAVLDGGPCREGIESTVISLVSETPTLLRPGVISLQYHIGHDASPGTRYKHYAPKAKINIYPSFNQVPASSEKRFFMTTFSHPDYHLMTPATFYALLRQADAELCTEIVVVAGDVSEGLKDRLLRAARN